MHSIIFILQPVSSTGERVPQQSISQKLNPCSQVTNDKRGKKHKKLGEWYSTSSADLNGKVCFCGFFWNHNTIIKKLKNHKTPAKFPKEKIFKHEYGQDIHLTLPHK